MHVLTKLAFAAMFLGIAATPIASAAGGGGGGMGGGGPSSSSSARQDPTAAYQAGVAAINAQNYREAVRQLRTARRALPHDGIINYALGVAYSGNGDKDEARRAFEDAARARNAPAGARLQIGLLALEAGDRAGAVEQQGLLATMVEQCDAACGDARRAQLQSAHDQLTRALTAPPNPAADPATTGWNFPNVDEGRAAYADAVGLINQERFPEAFAALERAQAAVGPHADVLNYMGFVSRKMGRFDAALAYYDEALQIDPNHLGATEYLGELYIQMGDMNRARSQLARLDNLCAYSCAQREELARWLAHAE